MPSMTDVGLPGTVRCPCGVDVAPTIPNGTRPRPHNDPATGRLCLRSADTPTAARCKRCGGTPDSPGLVWRGNTKVTCTSNMFHPQTWTHPELGLVGNPAACGEILGVSGETWWQRTRRPPAGSPGRAPKPDGYDYERRSPYWRIAVAEEVRDGMPSRTRPPRGHGHTQA